LQLKKTGKAGSALAVFSKLRDAAAFGDQTGAGAESPQGAAVLGKTAAFL